MSDSAAQLNPQALSLDEAVRVLKASGATSASVAQLEMDVANGAPTNADGTLNIVHYAAWLVKEFENGR